MSSSLADPEATYVVTGVSGFVGAHLLRLLLERGHRVRGTVRSSAQAEQVRLALAGLGVDLQALELHVVDLGRDDGWDAVCQGAQGVFHVASPLPRSRHDDPEQMLATARGGTLRALSAASRQGVRRVVMTSSISAVEHGHRHGGLKTLDESHWSVLDERITAYCRSKTLAERAAWDFVSGAGAGLELVTLQPGYILGPALLPRTGGSNEIIGKLVRREVPGLPRMRLPFVHVLDVAELHYRAMLTPAAADRRFCCALPSWSLGEVSRVLAEAGYRVTRLQLPDLAVRLVGLFDAEVALVVHELGPRPEFPCKPARELLGWQPRPIEQAILDAATSCVAQCG
jgi:dihydroflavonol-4-reductase